MSAKGPREAATYKHNDPVVQAIRDMFAEYNLYHPCGRPKLTGVFALCPCGCSEEDSNEAE